MAERPSRTRTGLLLAPGAGASREAPALVAIEQAATNRRWSVRRMDFPYRKAGRRAPDRAPVLLEAVREEAAAMAAEERLMPKRIVLGGRSMGGRICSMAVAEGLPAAALVLISYPLHPPGKPQQLRVDHFTDISVPCLFISGTRDAFGTPKELTKHTNAINSDVTHHWVEGGDHGLKRADDEVAAVVKAWLDALAL